MTVHRTKKYLATIGLLTAAGLVLAGCASESEAPSVSGDGALELQGETIADAELFKAALDEGSLVFYTGSSEQAESKLAAEFTADTGINVELVRLPPNRLHERVLSEHGAGQLSADIVRISGEDLTLDIVEAGVFTPHAVPAEYDLPADTILDDGLYYRSFDCVYSFAYNNQLVTEEEAPESWADLLDPNWKDQLGIVQVGAGGSTAALTRFQLAEFGEDYLAGYSAQNPRIFDSSGSQVDALARGEIKVGTMPISTGYAATIDGAPLTIATPTDQAVAFGYYMGVTESASNPNAAKVFLNWSMSKRGQEATGELGDYPVRTDVSAPSIGEQELPAVDSGFLNRPTADEILPNVEADATFWRTTFGYAG